MTELKSAVAAADESGDEAAINEALENLKEYIKSATILIASKGIHNNKFVYEIVNEIFTNISKHKII